MQVHWDLCFIFSTFGLFLFPPAWFLAIQIMMTLGLMLHMVTVVLNILYYVRCIPKEREKKYVMATAAMMWLACKSRIEKNLPPSIEEW